MQWPAAVSQLAQLALRPCMIHSQSQLILNVLCMADTLPTTADVPASSQSYASVCRPSCAAHGSRVAPAAMVANASLLMGLASCAQSRGIPSIRLRYMPAVLHGSLAVVRLQCRRLQMCRCYMLCMSLVLPLRQQAGVPIDQELSSMGGCRSLTADLRLSLGVMRAQLCRTFTARGDCPYGSRCRFVHCPSEVLHMLAHKIDPCICYSSASNLDINSVVPPLDSPPAAGLRHTNGAALSAASAYYDCHQVRLSA